MERNDGNKFIMKKIICIIILLSFIFLIADPEYFPFSEQEILNITNHIKQLEYSDSVNTELIKQYDIQIQNYKEMVITDSLELSYKDKEMALYKDYVKNNDLSWWEKIDQEVYFVMGILTTIGAGWALKNIN